MTVVDHLAGQLEQALELAADDEVAHPYDGYSLGPVIIGSAFGRPVVMDAEYDIDGATVLFTLLGNTLPSATVPLYMRCDADLDDKATFLLRDAAGGPPHWKDHT